MEEKLVIFVKAPRPGTVKTRLAESIGSDAACAAYVELVETLVQRLASVPHVDLRFTPDDASLELIPWLRPNWQLLPQGPGDLGARLLLAFESAFAGGARRVVIIGSDCPAVGVEHIAAAWRQLEEHDVVLGPATDGGYWLIGLKELQPSLFYQVPWSRADVLQTTIDRAVKATLRVHLLNEFSDVDNKEDWDRYRAQRDDPSPAISPSERLSCAGGRNAADPPREASPGFVPGPERLGQ